MDKHILAPAAALVIWSLLVLIWMLIVRIQAYAKLGLDTGNTPVGGRGQDLEGLLPDNVMWKSHNYTHLMEQPTLFYATVLILAMAGASAWDVRLAWAYCGLRVVHSLWQVLVNQINVRAPLFFLSTFCLIALAISAVMATL